MLPALLAPHLPHRADWIRPFAPALDGRQSLPGRTLYLLLQTVPYTTSPPALPMRIAPGHPASLTPTPTAVTV